MKASHSLIPALGLALALGGCQTLSNALVPSLPQETSLFAVEEGALATAETLAAAWANSGKETPAQAKVVEGFRVSAKSLVAAGRAARDAGDNIALAQAVDGLKQHTLATYLANNGAAQ